MTWVQKLHRYSRTVATDASVCHGTVMSTKVGIHDFPLAVAAFLRALVAKHRAGAEHLLHHGVQGFAEGAGEDAGVLEDGRVPFVEAVSSGDATGGVHDVLMAALVLADRVMGAAGSDLLAHRVNANAGHFRLRDACVASS